MSRILVETLIRAPISLVFDLARDVDAHAESAKQSGERVVNGRMSGLLELGDEVTFEARHFGLRQRLSAKIVEFDPPYRFVDEMQKGAFKSLRHTHSFVETSGVTTMVDDFDYVAPHGILGRFAEIIFLDRYMKSFLETRCAELKRMAEDPIPWSKRTSAT